MKYKVEEVKVADLQPAPWNPRKEITPESVADLAANIRVNGVLQNIGVWRDPESDELYVIYGNRRVVACRVAGVETVMAKVYTGTEVEAKERTRSENELRLGVNPIEDSKLLGSMRAAGRSEQEIAAHYGLSLATVCRRLKLADLAPSVIEKLEGGAEVTTDALERLAAYPVEHQDIIAKRFCKGGHYDWHSIAYDLRSLTRDLDDGKAFDDCKNCPLRTGATPDLFGEVEEGKLGRCLDQSCYNRHWNDLIQQRITEAVGPDVKERVKLRDDCTWQLADQGATKDKPDAKHPCAYYVVKYDGTVAVKFGPSKADKKAAAKRERDRAKKQKEKEELQIKMRRSVASKVSKWCKKNLRAQMKKWANRNLARILDLVIRFNIGNHSYGGNNDALYGKWTKDRTFDNWWTLFASSSLHRLMGEYICFEETRRVVEFFVDVKWGEVLTKEELAFVKTGKMA